MTVFFRYVFFVLIFLHNTVWARSGPEIRYLYDDEENEQMIAFFYDNSFARCEQCSLFNGDTIKKLLATPLNTRIEQLYTKDDESICIDSESCILLPKHDKKNYLWKIIDYRWVGDQPEYKSYDRNIPREEQQEVTLASLITPVFNNQKNTNDDDANEISADNAYYYAQTAECLGEYNLQHIETDKRYLVFTLDNGQKIMVDMKSDSNGVPINALLYRPGRIPFVVDLTDTDQVSAKLYLTGR